MKKLLFTLFSLMSVVYVQAQSMAINSSGASADNSAILDVSSTSKGFLPPRMTKSQRDAISSPAEGLIVYQTDNTPGYYFRKSSAWVQLLDPEADIDPNKLTGTVPSSKLGSGTADGSKFLRGDGTWAAPTVDKVIYSITKVTVSAGTFSYTIPNSAAGGYVYFNLAAGDSNASVILPNPSDVGNGAKIKFSYYNLPASFGSYGMQVKTQNGVLYAGQGTGNNVYITSSFTAEFITDGTDWYEVPSL